MPIDYQKLIEESGLELIKKILLSFKAQFHEDHCFYISFKTHAPLVKLSPKMKNRYPDEITIILQYQFEDLIVDDNGFSVKLSFDGVKEKILVPFNAITSFVDANTNFSLEFSGSFSHENRDSNVESISHVIDPQDPNSDPNIISLDVFRKNKTHIIK